MDGQPAPSHPPAPAALPPPAVTAPSVRPSHGGNAGGSKPQDATGCPHGKALEPAEKENQMTANQARKALEDAEAALTEAIRAGASPDDLYALDAATISAELAIQEAGRL